MARVGRVVVMNPLTLPLYWVNGLQLQSGSKVSAGNWGRVVRQYGTWHSSSARELALELVRQQVRPDAPSRLEAAFAFLHLEPTRVFRDQTRPGDCIYRVHPVNPAPPYFVADMDIINQWIQLANQQNAPRGWRELDLACGYWAGAGVDAPLAELLTLSDLEIVERVG